MRFILFLSKQSIYRVACLSKIRITKKLYLAKSKNSIMYSLNKLSKAGTLLFVMVILIVSCQKMDRPALGDYPKDSNPPGGPLKFYAAMDGASVDSIRANFGTDTKVTYGPGVSGDAMSVGTD